MVTMDIQLIYSGTQIGRRIGVCGRGIIGGGGCGGWAVDIDNVHKL